MMKRERECRTHSLTSLCCLPDREDALSNHVLYVLGVRSRASGRHVHPLSLPGGALPVVPAYLPHPAPALRKHMHSGAFDI
jgi:hypothetical protein